MTNTVDRPRSENRQGSDDGVVVDGTYLRGQADEAIRLFFTPISGVWTALMGTPDSKKGAAMYRARRKLHRAKLNRRKAKRA